MYRTEEFEIDDSNKEAYKLAEILGEQSKGYNPAVFFGESAVGKSHLMGVIAERLKHNKVPVKVITGDDLISEVIWELKSRGTMSVEEFCKRYDNIEVLIIEDIQTLVDKLATQEYLIGIIDCFMKKGDRQIILTMNIPPADLDVLNSQLKARFAFSVQTEIGKPTAELKMRILQKSEIAEKITSEAAELLMQKIQTIGELKGVCKNILLYLDCYGGAVNEEVVEKIWKMRKTARCSDS